MYIHGTIHEPVSPSIHPHIYSSIYPSIWMHIFIHSSTCINASMNTCLAIHLSIWMYLFVHLSIRKHLFIHPSDVSVHPAIWMYLFIYPSIRKACVQILVCINPVYIIHVCVLSIHLCVFTPIDLFISGWFHVDSLHLSFKNGLKILINL